CRFFRMKVHRHKGATSEIKLAKSIKKESASKLKETNEIVTKAEGYESAVVKRAHEILARKKKVNMETERKLEQLQERMAQVLAHLEETKRALRQLNQLIAALPPPPRRQGLAPAA
ncbi:hypothetical protein PMAYCL1PPCAC_25976, partial [Pristionchus mayeri]